MKVTANGISVHHTLDGPAGAPVVTLSHSLATDLSMWDPQMPALTARYRVLRYDTRGHGGTDAPAGAYTLEQLAEDARALLRALGIARTHWVGLSMGGMIGQALALTSPGVLGIEGDIKAVPGSCPARGAARHDRPPGPRRGPRPCMR